MIALLGGLGMQRPTPWTINMEPKNEGLEDDVPFQLGDFRLMHQFWRGTPLNLKPASVGLPDVKGDRSLSYGKQIIYVVHPRLPNTLWVGIWTPKTFLKNTKTREVVERLGLYPLTLGPQNPWKMKVLQPQNMGYLTPKNEGFTWVPMVRFIKPPGKIDQSCNSDDDDSHLLQLLGGGQHRRPRLCAPFGGPGAQGGSNKVGPGSSCKWSYKRPPIRRAMGPYLPLVTGAPSLNSNFCIFWVWDGEGALGFPMGLV